MPYCYHYNGKLCIVHPVPKENLEVQFGPLTDDEYNQLVISRLKLPVDIELSWVDNKDIPTDRTHRDAWELTYNSIVINPVKKAEIDFKLSAEMKRQAALEALIQEKINSSL